MAVMWKHAEPAILGLCCLSVTMSAISVLCGAELMARGELGMVGFAVAVLVQVLTVGEVAGTARRNLQRLRAGGHLRGRIPREGGFGVESPPPMEHPRSLGAMAAKAREPRSDPGCSPTQIADDIRPRSQ